MPYKLNNTLTIKYKDGQVEQIECSSIQFGGDRGVMRAFGDSSTPEYVRCFGRDSIIAHRALTNVESFDFTGLPVEQEEEVEQ